MQFKKMFKKEEIPSNGIQATNWTTAKSIKF